MVKYVATVAVQTADGKIIGRAYGMCSSAEMRRNRKTGQMEPRWQDEYAIMSMAQTRATSKAFRLVGSWIMALAGYEPTPAEEIEAIAETIEQETPTKSTYSQPQFNLVCKLIAEIAPEYINHGLESHTVHQLATILLAGANKDKASKVITRLKEVKEALATPQDKLTAEQEEHMREFGVWLMDKLGQMEKNAANNQK